MQSPPVPPTTWVRFTRGSAEPGHGERVDHYRIVSVTSHTGAALAGLEAGARFSRVESTAGVPPGAGDLLGVTQHLGYTRSAERAELASTVTPGPGAHVVVIPITKSARWWSLAHDERDRLFRGAGKADGHVAAGRPYAAKILRKLYHGRGLPGAGWDFLTYFEFEPELAEEFRTLVRSLRDPARNPEWVEVVREAEIWLARVS
jgi:chlorite dismutase